MEVFQQLKINNKVTKLQNAGPNHFHSFSTLLNSSIGMAKAALEASNGFNLFGREGTSWSVLYVDPDAHGRNRTILESLLPRESSSKVSVGVGVWGGGAEGLQSIWQRRNILVESLLPRERTVQRLVWVWERSLKPLAEKEVSG